MADEENHDLEPLLTNQQNQLSLVFSDSDSIDSKALAILAANIAIIIFVNQTARGLELWEYFLLYVPFALSLILDMISIWPRKYRGPGIDQETIPFFLGMNREALILQLLANTQEITQHNDNLNKKRLRLCFGSVILTGLGFLALLFIL